MSREDKIEKKAVLIFRERHKLNIPREEMTSVQLAELDEIKSIIMRKKAIQVENQLAKSALRKAAVGRLWNEAGETEEFTVKGLIASLNRGLIKGYSGKSFSRVDRAKKEMKERFAVKAKTDASKLLVSSVAIFPQEDRSRIVIDWGAIQSSLGDSSVEKDVSALLSFYNVKESVSYSEALAGFNRMIEELDGHFSE